MQEPRFFFGGLSEPGPDVALTAIDRALLQRCLNHQPGAWNDFVDRYLGLFYHVVHHTAHHRSVPLRPEDVEDVVAEVLVQVVAGDYAMLRQFRGRSSLATYLTVISRRICVHELSKRVSGQDGPPSADQQARVQPAREEARVGLGLESLEEVQRLLLKLPATEREVVRLFYLEGRSYEEISTRLHLPVNSIGPVLSRARTRLRKGPKKTVPPTQRDSPPKA